jgi:formate dehydrogenase assembly factor FdhD
MDMKLKIEIAPAPDASNPITSARWCPLCGTQHAVPKGADAPWPHITRNQIEALPALLDALQQCHQKLGQLHGSQFADCDGACETLRVIEIARATIALAQGGK